MAAHDSTMRSWPLRLRSAFGAALLAVSLLASASARADLLTFFLVGQLLESISSSMPAKAPGSRPTLAQTRAAAFLLNEQLPRQTSEGLALMGVKTPAPGALELEVVALSPKLTFPGSSELDAQWGPGLAATFCSGSSFWSAWVGSGGAVLVSLKRSNGELARQWSAQREDCAQLRAPR